MYINIISKSKTVRTQQLLCNITHFNRLINRIRQFFISLSHRWLYIGPSGKKQELSFLNELSNILPKSLQARKKPPPPPPPPIGYYIFLRKLCCYGNKLAAILERGPLTASTLPQYSGIGLIVTL